MTSSVRYNDILDIFQTLAKTIGNIKQENWQQSQYFMFSKAKITLTATVKH